MAMFLTPEENAANPPETWLIQKRAERRWSLCTKSGGVLDTFNTRREAEAARARGFCFDLYHKERRWFAGERVEGWKPYRPAKAEVLS